MQHRAKLYLLNLFIFGLCFSSVAQQKFDEDKENFFRFGFKGGLNANKIAGQSFSRGFSYNYQVGAFLQFNLDHRFGIQPEINFVQSKSEFTNDGTDIYDDIFRDGSQKKSKFNQLEFPLLLNINVGESRRLKLQVGPSLGIITNQSTDSLLIQHAIFKRNEWSVLGGIWLQLPLINIGTRYKAGLTNVNNIDSRENWKKQALQIFAGLTF